MSILQEYEHIRRNIIGEENYKYIEEFLDNHPEYYLSDVYYRPEVFDQMVSETNYDISYLPRYDYDPNIYGENF